MPPASATQPKPAEREGALTGFGCGKIILLGEHSVVYGHPALAAPLSWGVWAFGAPARRPRLEMPSSARGDVRRILAKAFVRAAAVVGAPGVRVSLQSDLPVGMGLGSSAALSVACARVLLQAAGRPAKPGEVVRIALEMEREFHGRPSGVDHTCSAEGRLIQYRLRPKTGEGTSRPIQSLKPLKVLVALAGPRSPTHQTVTALRQRVEQWPKRYARLLGEVGKLVVEGAKAIESGDLEALGDVMDANQGLLGALRLSSSGLDEMSYRLRKLGALGAKLTGAGGDGGAVIGLFREPEPAVFKLTRMGVRCFSSQVGGPLAL